MDDSRSCKAVVVIVAALIAGALHAEVAVTSIAPASGLTRGGEIVHIHGANLLGAPLLCPAVTCATYVKFGDTAFGEIVDNTAAEIVVIAPPHAAGRVDLQVNVPPNPPVTLPSAYAYIDPPLTDRVLLLVPIVIDAAGAGGTNWVSELVVHNENSEPLPIDGATVPPLATSILRLNPSAGNAGAFLEVPQRLAANVSASLRVHDTTRDGDSWGTDVPVVPETQFGRSLVLAAVPTDARYRTLLRVYGYAGHDTAATVTFRDDASGDLLATRTLTTQSGYAQLPIDVTGAPRLRVQVTAASSLLWAFVSITNNATQQVTTITPAVTPSAVVLPNALTIGQWGSGGQVCVNVTDTVVTLNAGCLHGAFPLPAVGPDGHFEADGTLYFGGPAPAVPPPAHFSGAVQGTLLTLTARSGDKTTGTWTVDFNDKTRCTLCL
jgi:hypothetical protein